MPGGSGYTRRMSNPMAEDPEAYWNEMAGPRWVASQEQLDRMLEGITARLLEAADPRTGEQVIDVGCGCGATTLLAAQRVGETGSVVGLDLSRPMLDHARTRRPPELGQVDFVLADAAKHTFEKGSVDLLISRFGVMFFPDPVAAFSNLRGSLRDGGRAAFVCWREPGLNPWISLAMQALPEVEAPPLPPADKPGPFSLQDRETVERILGAAGFTDVELEALDVPVQLGADLDQVEYMYTQIGPLALLLRDASDEDRASIMARVRTHLAEQIGEGGLSLPSASWIVHARA